MQSVARVKSARTRQRLDVKTCQWLAGTHKTSENRGLLLAQHHLSLQTPAYMLAWGTCPLNFLTAGQLWTLTQICRGTLKFYVTQRNSLLVARQLFVWAPHCSRHWLNRQETQLSLTNRATHLRKRNGVADLLKHAHPYMCYHAEFGRSALNDVGINTGEPKKIGGALEHHSLEMGGVADPQDTRMCIRYGMCYHVRFVSSATKGICINSKEPQNWGALGPRPLGVGVADHLRISSLAVLPCEIW